MSGGGAVVANRAAGPGSARSSANGSSPISLQVEVDQRDAAPLRQGRRDELRREEAALSRGRDAGPATLLRRK